MKDVPRRGLRRASMCRNLFRLGFNEPTIPRLPTDWSKPDTPEAAWAAQQRALASAWQPPQARVLRGEPDPSEPPRIRGSQAGFHGGSKRRASPVPALTRHIDSGRDDAASSCMGPVDPVLLPEDAIHLSDSQWGGRPAVEPTGKPTLSITEPRFRKRHPLHALQDATHLECRLHNVKRPPPLT